MSCYLDNASTTWIYPECTKGIEYILNKVWYNPSNNYIDSEMTKDLIEIAKIDIAGTINCEPEEIFFTSGASEGNAFVIFQRENVLCSPWEHHNYLESEKVTIVPENYFDTLSTDSFMQECYKQTFANKYCYAHMLVSNITGEIFDVNKNFNLAHKYGMLCACDMTQAYGNINIDMQNIDCDIAVFSGHKFHAPKGIGFMFIRKDIQNNIKPMICGTQQSGLRGGTENVAYINALRFACVKATQEIETKQQKSKILVQECIKKLNESGIEWMPISGNTSVESTFSFCLKGVEGEIIQQMLNQRYINIATGSGCNTGDMKRDNALVELEIPEEYIGGFFRLSFSLANTVEEIDEAIDALVESYNELTK